MRAALVLVLLVPVLALATGCGASLASVANAATKSNSQTSEHIALTSKTSAAGKTYTLSGSGDFQNQPALGGMTMNVEIPGHPMTIRDVLAGTKVYASSDALGALLPSGKSWLEIDYAAAAKKLGVDVASIGAQSPTVTLQQLEQSGHTKKIGTETIDGVQTTHYQATVPEKNALTLANLSKGKVSIQPVDVWVDANGLVRRVHFSYSAQEPGAGGLLTNDTTLDVSNYGEAVNVTVPSPAETYDFGGTP